MSQENVKKRDYYVPKESCINCEISLEMAEDFVVSVIKKSLCELKYYEQLATASRSALGLEYCKASEKKLMFIHGTLERLGQAYPKTRAWPI